MAHQTSFVGIAWTNKGRVTRRERFLIEMDTVIPWARLVALIEPHYPKAGRGRRPLGLEKMLRIYFLQQWFDLSDPAAEDASLKTANPCAASSVSSWARTWCPTSPPSCASGTCSRSMS